MTPKRLLVILVALAVSTAVHSTTVRAIPGGDPGSAVTDIAVGVGNVERVVEGELNNPFGLDLAPDGAANHFRAVHGSTTIWTGDAMNSRTWFLGEGAELDALDALGVDVLSVAGRPYFEAAAAAALTMIRTDAVRASLNALFYAELTLFWTLDGLPGADAAANQLPAFLQDATHGIGIAWNDGELALTWFQTNPDGTVTNFEVPISVFLWEDPEGFVWVGIVSPFALAPTVATTTSTMPMVEYITSQTSTIQAVTTIDSVEAATAATNTPDALAAAEKIRSTAVDEGGGDAAVPATTRSPATAQSPASTQSPATTQSPAATSSLATTQSPAATPGATPSESASETATDAGEAAPLDRDRGSRLWALALYALVGVFIIALLAWAAWRWLRGGEPPRDTTAWAAWRGLHGGEPPVDTTPKPGDPEYSEPLGSDDDVVPS